MSILYCLFERVRQAIHHAFLHLSFPQRKRHLFREVKREVEDVGAGNFAKSFHEEEVEEADVLSFEVVSVILPLLLSERAAAMELLLSSESSARPGGRYLSQRYMGRP